MTTKIIFPLALILLFRLCSEPTNPQAASSTTGDPVVSDITVEPDSMLVPRHADSLQYAIGDFDGDGVPDSARVLGPYIYGGETGMCIVCETKVVFNHRIDTLVYPWEAIGAQLYNAGDLDGNDRDEILFIPDWFNGCGGEQLVYTLTPRGWDTLITGSVYRCNERNTIRKIRNGVFDMEIHRTSPVWGDTTIRVHLR